MDLVGPLPKSANGMEYILVLNDYLTKWVEVRALPDKRSQTVAIGLLKVFGTCGIPATLISDQGNEFTSAAIRSVYAYLGIERRSSTPHHPQTNGLTERFNRTLKDMIAKVTLTTTIPWDDVLEWVMGNYRSTPQKSTGDSPFFLEKGRDPFMPLDAMRNGPGEVYGRDVDLDANPVEDKGKFVEMLEQIAKDTRAALEQIQQQAKEKFDEDLHEPENICVGDLVKIREMASGAGKKLKYRFTGPYRVMGPGKHPDTFALQMARNTVETWNRSKLRLYFRRDPKRR